MPALQWAQLYFCNFINICDMKPESRMMHGFCILVEFGLHAENTNKVTEI